MAQTWTIVSLAAAVASLVVFCLFYLRASNRDTVAVRLRLDHSAAGAHLMWDIANQGAEPITVTRLVIGSVSGRGDRRRTERGQGETIALRVAQTLQSHEHALIPTDVDWALLSAKSIAVGDAEGGEHRVPPKQLRAIQGQLRTLFERHDEGASAGVWLSGATNLAFGVVILGLGFFMLMWVIATG